MKQTVTIMAVFMVALLLVSGFIMAGSLQQAEQLSIRALQLAELKSKLREQTTMKDQLDSRAQGLSIELATITKERNTLTVRLAEATASIDEANGAVAVQVQELDDTKLSFLQARDVMETSLGEQQTLSEVLTTELEKTKTERDSAVTGLRALEAEHAQVLVQVQTLEAERVSMMAQLKEIEQDCDRANEQLKELEKRVIQPTITPTYEPSPTPTITLAPKSMVTPVHILMNTIPLKPPVTQAAH